MKKLGAFIIIAIFLVNMFLPFQYVSANSERAQINEPTILYEDETKRSEYEKHFVCSDGSYIAATYPEQVCYLNEEGIWQEIDNSLEKIDGRYENKNSDMKVSFAEKANDSKIIELSNGKHNLAWNLDFSQINSSYSLKEKVLSMFYTKKINYEEFDETIENDIIVANNIEAHVTYENIYSNTVDVQYTVLPGRIKENIILNEKTSLSSYNMNISCEGLTAKIDEENGVEFYDANNELQYEIQTPYMFDDVYEVSYDIEIELQETDSGYTITFYPDLEWLNSNERVYPITIDPIVKTGTNKVNFSDTYIYQGDSASSSRCFEERLRVGIYNDKIYRVFWKASELPSLGNNDVITSARMYFTLPAATTTSRNFSIYQVNNSWTSESITWSNASSFSYTLLRSNIKRDVENNTVRFEGTKLTNTVKEWYNNGNNNGFTIRYTDESKTNPDYNLFYSSDNTSNTSFMPLLSISYLNKYNVENLKIYQTERTYYNDENGEEYEDIKCNTKTKAEILESNANFAADFPRTVSARVDNWKLLCRSTSSGNLQTVLLDMVNTFMSGVGGDYSHIDLTNAAENHYSTEIYVEAVIEYVKDLLSEYDGDITKLRYTASTRASNPLVKKLKNNNIYQPCFDEASDLLSGLKMCVNDLWGNEIYVQSYACSGATYSITLKFTLYDHFGLDINDITKFGTLAGFRDWYILQHLKDYNGAYKPMVTKMTFTRSFTGTI